MTILRVTTSDEIQEVFRDTMPAFQDGGILVVHPPEGGTRYYSPSFWQRASVEVEVDVLLVDDDVV